MSRVHTSQPENGDVTPTASQLRFNLAEETVWNVITAKRTPLLRVFGRVSAPYGDVCVCDVEHFFFSPFAR